MQRSLFYTFPNPKDIGCLDSSAFGLSFDPFAKSAHTSALCTQSRRFRPSFSSFVSFSLLCLSLSLSLFLCLRLNRCKGLPGVSVCVHHFVFVIFLSIETTAVVAIASPNFDFDSFYLRLLKRPAFFKCDKESLVLVHIRIISSRFVLFNWNPFPLCDLISLFVYTKVSTTNSVFLWCSSTPATPPLRASPDITSSAIARRPVWLAAVAELSPLPGHSRRLFVVQVTITFGNARYLVVPSISGFTLPEHHRLIRLWSFLFLFYPTSQLQVKTNFLVINFLFFVYKKYVCDHSPTLALPPPLPLVTSILFMQCGHTHCMLFTTQCCIIQACWWSNASFDQFPFKNHSFHPVCASVTTFKSESKMAPLGIITWPKVFSTFNSFVNIWFYLFICHQLIVFID